MSFKTTIDVPVKGQTARCTVEVPLDAIGATTNGVRNASTNEVITTFTSKVTAAFTEVVTPGHSDAGTPATIDTTNPRDNVITINFRRSNGQIIPCKIDYEATLRLALSMYASRIGQTASSLNVFYRTKAISADDSAKSLDMVQGDNLDIRLMRVHR